MPEFPPDTNDNITVNDETIFIYFWELVVGGKNTLRLWDE